MNSNIRVDELTVSVMSSKTEEEAMADSTSLNYWLNWRFLLCAIWVLTPTLVGSLTICKFERLHRRLRGDEPWRPCLKQLHPASLLVFRVLAFCLLLTALVCKAAITGGRLVFYYTQWTLTLLTLYFACGSLLSAYGCYRCMTREVSGIHNGGGDSEQGFYTPLISEETADIDDKRSISNEEKDYIFRVPEVLHYVFEVLFQINVGAVMLTDTVYWVFIFPFLTIQDYAPSFLTISIHSINLVLLLGETALNCLEVPFIRISFFVILTGIFVVFQWIVHACVSMWWPYPFLDLSSSNAPLWYLFIGVLHVPCYGTFALIVKAKHYLLRKWFPHSFQP